MGTQSDFNCVAFDQSHDFLTAAIATGNNVFLPLAPLVDAEDDALNRVYQQCQDETNQGNPHGFIDFVLFSEMFNALQEFE
jgi:hypothetical protein